MGVVYEAVQQSLGRHVALKVLPHQALAGSSQLERFRLEARAAARLHHTNIVPVFGVGECEGVHYYAMQFIQGQGLDVVIDALRRLRDGSEPAVGAGSETPGTAGGDDQPLTAVLTRACLTGRFAAAAAGARARPSRRRDGPRQSTSPPSPGSGRAAHRRTGRAVRPRPMPAAPPSCPPARPRRSTIRSVARVGVQVAEALAHAHGQGILHRDIKPSNLLLDAKGTVWVTDFGLAKAEGSDGLTQTGDIVGTLRYMAPERFDGWSDPRSDVYSLGATLYELLTLRPPFQEPDRAKLIEQVMHEEPDAAPQARPAHPARPGDDRAQGDGQGAGPAVRDGRADGRGPAAVRGRPADPGAADRPGRADLALVQAQPDAGGRGRRRGGGAGGRGGDLGRLRHRAGRGRADEIRGLAADLGKERESLRKSLGESNRLLAIRNFDRGQAAFEKGEIGPGYALDDRELAVGRRRRRSRLAARRAGQPGRLATALPPAQRGLSHTMPVHSAAFSPDSRTVISGSMDGTAQLWDAANGKRIGSPLQQGGEWLRVGFSPDGKTALTCSEGKRGTALGCDHRRTARPPSAPAA